MGISLNWRSLRSFIGNNTKELNDLIFAGMKEVVEKKPLKGADRMVVDWYRDTVKVDVGAAVAWIKAQIDLDGSKRGKQLAEVYKRFDNDYAEEIYEKITKREEKITESYWAEIKTRQYSIVNREEFIALMPVSLDDSESEKEDAPGFWEFSYEGPAWLHEIYNFGDRMELTLLVEAPEILSEKGREEVLKKTRDKYGDARPTPEASAVEILRYPEYEQFIWLKAIYPYDGKITGEQIGNAYSEFVDKYSEKAAKDIHKWMEKAK
jgi:hypothetical protein